MGCVAIFLIFPGLHQYIPSTFVPGAIDPESNPLVQSQNYSTITLSTDPLFVYIYDFLSVVEIDHILNVTKDLFVPSRVYSPGSSSHRNSSSCLLPSSDPTHDLVVARSKYFLDKVIQEHPSTGLSYFDIEPLQLVKYGRSEYYHAHVDWFDTLHRENKRWNPRLYNRGASFFIYLEDECEGGGTLFPQITASANQSQWSELERLMKQDEKGLSFKPRKGNGLFWVNLKPDGIGDDRLLHAGLPVTQGRKVGMNIWVKRDFGW
jgi:prolyl 4-hydroxylase